MNDILAFIDENNIPIVNINPTRRYWLVRTSAGEYYDYFYFDDYIAIGWNEFNDKEKFVSVEKEVLIRQIEDAYSENRQPGLIYNQIGRFFFEMEIGDIVMIPSQNSNYISFGEITSDAYIAEINEDDIEEGACPYQKRRDVKWIKTVKRKSLDPLLYRMMQSHHTINNANEYADAIDRTLHDFYIKGEQVNLILHVEQKKQIAAIDLIEGINNVLELATFVKNPYEPEENFKKRDIDLKLRVESPGVIQFISVGPEGWVVLGIGIVLVFLVGGKINFTRSKEQTNLEVSSDGLLDKILQFKKHNSEEKLKVLEAETKENFEKLQIELPENIKKLPEQTDIQEATYTETQN